MSRYVTSNRHIAGCVAACGGPALALTGVVAPVTGLVLVPAFYAAGVLATRRKKRKATVVAGVRTVDVDRRLGEIQRHTAGRVPPQISVKVASIASTITETLPRAHALGTGSPGQYVLVQCATDYLPSALRAYLRLPRTYADRHAVSNGKTALVLLSEQLDLLKKEIDEIAEAVNQADTDKLIANGRFLEDKFGRDDLDVT